MLARPTLVIQIWLVMTSALNRSSQKSVPPVFANFGIGTLASVSSSLRLVRIENQDRQGHCWSDKDTTKPRGVDRVQPLPGAEPRLGRRTALTFPLLPPPQKN
jgi:hypothetical protein